MKIFDLTVNSWGRSRASGGIALHTILCASLILTACAALPDKPVRSVTYDFGPGAIVAAAVQTSNASQALPPIALAEIDSSAALNGSAVLYRLMYFNTQELRPYAQARWSMPPAQLLRQRLSARLSQTRAVLNPGDGITGSVSPWSVRLELEEFSHLFESTTASTGLLRLRATVVQSSAPGEKLMGQRTFVVQRPAPSSDVAGGVQALSAASDAVVLEIDQWLQTLHPSR
jgi:cholesterol transport system auxiliary component